MKMIRNFLLFLLSLALMISVFTGCSHFDLDRNTTNSKDRFVFEYHSEDKPVNDDDVFNQC